LNGCAASVGCKTEEFLERGDHLIVIGQVIALHKNLEPIDPLIYFQGRYRSLQHDD
jgi:flavin reductase (DIM6/NTAB) family NADH-FMN oxidoreductase RutF